MELTKEQILFIEEYLIEQGVKYWDVRIELIDHLATKLEENPKIVLTRTFLITEFGSSISLRKMIYEKRIILNRKYQKAAIKEVKNIFYSSTKTLFFLFFVGGLIFSFVQFNFLLLKRMSMTLIIIPMAISLIVIIKNLIITDKVLHVESSAQIIVVLSLCIQTLAQLHFLNASLFLKILFFILLLSYLLIFYAGSIVYKKTEDEFKEIYKKLQPA